MEQLNFCGRRGQGGCAPADAEDIREPDAEVKESSRDYAGEPWIFLPYSVQ